MPKISPFEKYADQYEEWFKKNRWVYEAELRAVKAMLPAGGRSVEIGVGTGRFAEPLAIKIGVEHLKRMRQIAQKRGIRVLDGVADEFPLGATSGRSLSGLGNIKLFTLMASILGRLIYAKLAYIEVYNYGKYNHCRLRTGRINCCHIYSKGKVESPGY